jgi:hypothetical protein
MSTQSPWDRYLAKEGCPKLHFENIKIGQIELIKVPFDSKKDDGLKPAQTLGPKLQPGLRFKTKNPKNKSAAKSASAPKKDEKMTWEFEYAPQGEKRGLTVTTCLARAGFCRAQTGNWNECPDGKGDPQWNKDVMSAEQEFTITNEAYHDSIKKDDGGSRSFDSLTKFYQSVGERMVELLMTKHKGESAVVDHFMAECLEKEKKSHEQRLQEAKDRLASAEAKGHAAKPGIREFFLEDIERIQKSNPENEVTAKAVFDQIAAAQKFKMHIELNKGKDGYASNFAHKAGRPLFRAATPDEVAKGLNILVKDPKDDDKKKLAKLAEVLRTRQLIYNGVEVTQLPSQSVKNGEILPARQMAFDELGSIFGHVIALVERLKPMIDYGPQSDSIGFSVQILRCFHALDKVKLAATAPRKSYEASASDFNLSTNIETGMMSQLADGGSGGNNSNAPAVETKWKNDADMDMTSDSNNSSSSSSSSSSNSATEKAMQAIKASTAHPPTFASTKPGQRPVTPSEYSRDNAEILEEFKHRAAEGDIPSVDHEESSRLSVPVATKPLSRSSPVKRPRAELTMYSAGKDDDGDSMTPPQPAAKRQKKGTR